MITCDSWFDVVRDMLVDEGEEACLALIRTVAPARLPAPVCLVEGDLAAEEALAYARILFDLGRDLEGDDVLRAVIAALLGSGLAVVPVHAEPIAWVA